MIAIHNSTSGFHPRWIEYCERNNVLYKLVNCYSNNLIEELDGCSALMWHYNQNNYKDNLVAKQILFALEHTNFYVFPDFKTAWHFDDKVGQKYLFERIMVPFVPSYVFFTKREAMEWAHKATFPMVFKLRGGAGSQNVQLVKTHKEAIALISKAFGKGFSKYDAWTNLKERYRKFRIGLNSYQEVIKGVIRLFYKPAYARLAGNENGYVYFQEFIPNNDCDIRIVVIDGKAFALKRFIRENDFRASGSGKFSFDKSEFNENTVELAFKVANLLNLQITVLDFVYDLDNNPLIVELSYGYAHLAYDNCPGYWDEHLKWHEGNTVKEDWMVQLVLKSINQ
jgi:glutathione synthase/RimK-type ligase-like ATP-grasp enzyme